MKGYDLPSRPAEEVDINIHPVPAGFVFSDETKKKAQQSFRKARKLSKDFIVSACKYLRMSWS